MQSFDFAKETHQQISEKSFKSNLFFIQISSSDNNFLNSSKLI